MDFIQIQKTKLLSLHQQKPWLAGSIFFIGGVFFDILTLGKIDDTFNILQQSVFLVLLTALLLVEFFDVRVEQRIPEKLKFFWRYREELVHFLFGCLLSIYTIFFVQSASFFTSFFFLLFFGSILVANELPQFRHFGLAIRSSLLCICYISFFSYVIPMLWGDIGWIPFFLAILCTNSVVGLVFLFLYKKNIENIILLKKFVYPSIAVCLFFIFLYWIAWIPPLPLSLQYVGVYHQIEKSSNQYHLAHQNPWWKFWYNGDQHFYYRTGDKVYIFSRIFSPATIRSKIFIRWFFLEKNQQWQVWDRIPIQVSGGREEGFRGIAVKEHVSEGEWKVQIETNDGREIGRIYFTIEKDSNEEPREFNYHIN